MGLVTEVWAFGGFGTSPKCCCAPTARSQAQTVAASSCQGPWAQTLLLQSPRRWCWGDGADTVGPKDPVSLGWVSVL